jgi:ADP-heptose:LPS heptosyltransferase
VAPPAADDLPIWQHLLRTVGAPLDGDTGLMRASPTLVEVGRHALRDGGWDGARPVLLLHPGAGSVAKRWPVAGFAAVARDLCRARPLAVAVHEGPADGDAAAALIIALGPQAIRLREPPLEALAGALASAALYLGNDSGVSHLAAAVGAPSMVLFTRALLGWRPWAPATRLPVVSTKELIAADLAQVMATARAALA